MDESREGGALPVVVPITGPREPHDYRNQNLQATGYNLINEINNTGEGQVKVSYAGWCAMSCKTVFAPVYGPTVLPPLSI